MDIDKLSILASIVTSSGPPPKHDHHNLYQQYRFRHQLSVHQLIYLLELYRPYPSYHAKQYISHTYNAKSKQD